MALAKIKKGDHVIVLTGRDKGKHGEVIEVRPKESRALVRGVNMVRRHQRQTAQAGRRHHLQGSPDPPFEPRARGSARTASRRASASRSSKTATKVRFAKRSGEVIPEKSSKPWLRNRKAPGAPAPSEGKGARTRQGRGGRRHGAAVAASGGLQAAHEDALRGGCARRS